MLATNYVFNSMMNDLAAIAAFTPAGGSENYLILFKNNFTPDALTVAADLVEADFTGYAAKLVDATDIFYYVDALTSERRLSFQPLAAPFIFELTTDLVASQTIYGFALVNHAKDTLYAAQLFDTPIVLNTAVVSIEVPLADIVFDPEMGNIS